MQLDEIKIGWKTLAEILNRIRGAVNENDPIQGKGISLSKTKSGTIIATDKKGSEDAQLQSLQQGQWIQVQVMDDNCVRSTIWVWGSYAQPSVEAD